jgi:hypothetical protein
LMSLFIAARGMVRSSSPGGPAKGESSSILKFKNIDSRRISLTRMNF